MRILLYTTAPVLAEGFNTVRAFRDGVEPTAMVGNIADLVAKVTGWKPDVILLDTPGQVDFGSIAALATKCSPCKIVLWVYSITVEMAHRARAMGVRGVLRKDLSEELMARCLATVAAGDLWFDRALLNSMLQVREVKLSPRERQLLRLNALGLSNKELAAELEISEGTVKVYLAKLFRKVGVHDRYELALSSLRSYGGAAPSATENAPAAFSASLIIHAGGDRQY